MTGQPEGIGILDTRTYRGVGVDEAITSWNFESVWALLVDGQPGSPLPPAEEFPLTIHTGDNRVDMQAALAGIAPVWGLTSVMTTELSEARAALARASVLALSFLAQSARGSDVPAVPAWRVDEVRGAARRFLMRWKGEADERFVRAINAGWIAVAADANCPSLHVAATTAATGADVAACLSAAVAAASGPLAAGGAAQLAALLEHSPTGAEAEEFRRRFGFTRTNSADSAESVRHSPRVRALEAAAREVGSDYRSIAAHTVEFSRYRHPRFSMEQLLTTLWATHLFAYAGVPPRMLSAMLACGKTAGWSAVILIEYTRLLESLDR